MTTDLNEETTTTRKSMIRKKERQPTSINKLKNLKAVGVDEISAEFFHTFGKKECPQNIGIWDSRQKAI